MYIWKSGYIVSLIIVNQASKTLRLCGGIFFGSSFASSIALGHLPSHSSCRTKKMCRRMSGVYETWDVMCGVLPKHFSFTSLCLQMRLSTRQDSTMGLGTWVWSSFVAYRHEKSRTQPPQEAVLPSAAARLSSSKPVRLSLCHLAWQEMTGKRPQWGEEPDAKSAKAVLIGALTGSSPQDICDEIMYVQHILYSYIILYIYTMIDR